MAASRIEFHRLWIEQCAAAQRIKQRLGLGNALDHLVGEKLLRFVETAQHNSLFAQELASFVAEIKRIFSLHDLGNYAVRLERTKRLSVPQGAAIRAIWCSVSEVAVTSVRCGMLNQLVGDADLRYRLLRGEIDAEIIIILVVSVFVLYGVAALFFKW